MKIWDHQADDLESPIAMHPAQIHGNVPYDEGNRAYALIIDENVVETSVANPAYFNILMSNPEIIDITNEYPDIDPELGYVLKFIVNNEEKLIAGVKKRYGAILLSNPKFIEIQKNDRAVQIGWKHGGINFYCPPDFNPESDEHY